MPNTVGPRAPSADTLYADALAKVRQIAFSRLKPGSEEKTPADALGRIVAEAVRSPVSIPQYANSAVDGFALRSSEVGAVSPSSPMRISVRGSIIAGNTPPSQSLLQSQSKKQTGADLCAWEIMTGAPFPESFDCSVKVEDVEVIRDSSGRAKEIILTESLTSEENLRGAGEDFLRGDSVLQSGDRIGPEHILALEALGISKVQVFRKPNVAIISTGGELCAPGENPREGGIRNSTAPFLLAALREMGAEVHHSGTAGDDPAEYFALLKRALESKPDVVISTGAVSMGIHDYVSSVVSDLGGKIAFHRVSIRPGKPILVAEFPNTLFFGLPGNPVATVVGLRFFVDPFLRACMGQPEEKPMWVRLSAPVRKPEGLRCFFKTRMNMGKGETSATILAGQPSFMISPLLQSTAWGVLPETGNETPAREWIEVYPFYSSSYSWAGSNTGAGSHSPVAPSRSHSAEGDCCT